MLMFEQTEHTSGMANLVFSVAIRKGACILQPTSAVYTAQTDRLTKARLLRPLQKRFSPLPLFT